MCPKWAQKATPHNDKILQDMFWSLFGPILGTTWATSGSSWPVHTNIDANLLSELLFSSPQDDNKTSKQLLCEFCGGLLARQTFKNHWFSIGFSMFLQSCLLATHHARRDPSKPKICLKRPSWTPQEGPRRPQDSPRWAQDGPRKWRPSTGKSCKICSGASLDPSWGQLGPLRAQLGPSTPT